MNVNFQFTIFRELFGIDLPFVSEFVDTELSVVASTFIDVRMKGGENLGLKSF
jgi:hypothetical protein